MQLVRSRTLHILAPETITAREYGGRMRSDQIKQLDAEQIDAMFLNEDVKCALKANVAVIRARSEQIEAIERRIQEQVKSRIE